MFLNITYILKNDAIPLHASFIKKNSIQSIVHEPYRNAALYFEYSTFYHLFRKWNKCKLKLAFVMLESKIVAMNFT